MHVEQDVRTYHLHLRHIASRCCCTPVQVLAQNKTGSGTRSEVHGMRVVGAGWQESGACQEEARALACSQACTRRQGHDGVRASQLVLLTKRVKRQDYGSHCMTWHSSASTRGAHGKFDAQPSVDTACVRHGIL